MPKRRSKKTKSRVLFFKWYIVTGILLFGVISAGIFLMKPKPTLHPLARLSVPKTFSVYLPDIYVAPVIQSWVLGAETIDPSDILAFINDERMKRGTAPLRANKVLTQAAKQRTEVILKYQNFSHQDPYEHIQLDTVLPRLGYPFIYASENIGMGDTSATQVVGGFMSSTPHRINLLNPNLKETGIDVAAGNYKGYWTNITVQIFAIPATRDQYLGYKQEDIDLYKNLLTDVRSQLALTHDRLDNRVGDQKYYEGWQKILIRQQEILTTLYDTMLQQQPFVNNLIALITEYNNNWNLVPKT